MAETTGGVKIDGEMIQVVRSAVNPNKDRRFSGKKRRKVRQVRKAIFNAKHAWPCTYPHGCDVVVTSNNYQEFSQEKMAHVLSHVTAQNVEDAKDLAKLEQDADA